MDIAESRNNIVMLLLIVPEFSLEFCNWFHRLQGSVDLLA
jgi:hypothetical protein